MRTINRAARQAVEECLGIVEGEVVVIVTDRATLKIGLAVKKAAQRITDNIHFFVMEDFGVRPFNFPQQISDALKEADISFYIIQDMKGERMVFRKPMFDIIEKSTHSRHVHMAGISEAVMKNGVCCNYQKIKKFSQLVYQRVCRAKEIRVLTKAGTDLTLHFSPQIKWIICSGIITTGHWENLPEGEVFTCPQDVNGLLVVDGCLGDYLDKKYGILGKTPLSVSIENGLAVLESIKCVNQELEKEFKEYIFYNVKNSYRVGEFAFGTNTGIKKIIGNLLQDEKMPGVHLAFGNPYFEETGADWDSDTHIDCVIQKPTVFVDGEIIMRNGKYLLRGGEYE